MKRIYVIFLLVLLVHIIACVLYWMLRADQTWIPPTDFGSISTDTFDLDRGFLFRYMKLMYHSTLTYAMVDISTRRDSELLIMTFVLIIAAVINAIIFGQFAVLTEEVKADSNEYVDKLGLINTVLSELKQPPNIRNEVREYIAQTHNLKKLQDEFKAFNDNLSKRQKDKIKTKVLSDVYRQSSLVANMKVSLYKEWLRLQRLNK